MKEEYTVGDIARMLNVDRTTVFRWVQRGVIEAYSGSPGSNYKITRENLVKYLKEHNLPKKYFNKAGKKKVLIADDNKEILSALEAVFKSEGFKVETTTTGIEAGLLIHTFRPDVILLDNVFTEDEGEKFCRTVRQDPELVHTKLVSITGSIEKSDEEILEQGFDAVMRKPFDFDTMNAYIRGLEL